LKELKIVITTHYLEIVFWLLENLHSVNTGNTSWLSVDKNLETRCFGYVKEMILRKSVEAVQYLNRASPANDMQSNISRHSSVFYK